MIKFMEEAWNLSSIKDHIVEEIRAYTAMGDTKRLEKWRYMQDVMSIMLKALPWQ